MFDSKLAKFVQEFKDLWKSGLDAHLDVHTSAGEAWVSLRVHLGQVHGRSQEVNPHFTRKRNRNGPSRERRHLRRAAKRAAQTAASVEDEEDSTENVEAAGKVTSEEVETAPTTEKVIGPIPEAEEVFQCDLCDMAFKTVRGLKAHKGRTHKKIPQFDGASEELEDTFTFLSDYAEEDITYTLVESLTKEIDFEMVSRVKTKDVKSADHVCTVRVSVPYHDWQWPRLNDIQEKVFRDLKRGSHHSC